MTNRLGYIETIEAAVCGAHGDGPGYDAAVEAALNWYADQQIYLRWTVENCEKDAKARASVRARKRKSPNGGGAAR